MEKRKLFEERVKKGFSQLNIADELGIDESNYCRREKGLAKISIEEWEKLSQILNVEIEDIYESEETNLFICKDSASSNLQGINVYAVPKDMLETQQKYIQKIEKENQKLEEENSTLKIRLKKYENN